MILMHRPG